MSRIGKKPVVIPSGVKAELKDGVLTITGPKGNLSLEAHPKVSLQLSDSEILVSVTKQEDKREKALWGLTRALIQNLVDGVTKGFTKDLDVIGVGYKVEVKGQKMILNLGFSHPIEYDIPAGIEVKVEKQPTKATIQQYQTTIFISGNDKHAVGQFAANIRTLKKPEPYKGKGIKYSDEILLRKAGKVVKAVGGGK